MTYLIFIIIQLNLCSRDKSKRPAYVIWISRTWFLSIKIIKNFMIFMNFQEYTRGKNHVYSWIEISCWDGFSGFCPKMQIFIIFDDFSMNLAHFALGRWFFWWILWIFAFWLGQKLSHQPEKKISRNQIIVPKVKF